MKTTVLRVLSLGAIGVASSLIGVPSAYADTKQECSAAYDEIQALRKESQLRAAHVKGATCAQDACPAFIRKDCDRWLLEIESSQPTVVFAATDAAGADVSAVTVTFDGQVLQTSLDGKSVPADPGKHKLRFELAGADPVEQDITILEGEKNRKIAVTFGKAKTAALPGSPAVPAIAPTAPPSPPPPAQDTTSEGVPVWAWASGGLGVVLVGTGIVFLVLEQSANSDVDACKGYGPTQFSLHDCSSSNSAAVRDFGLFLGLGGAGVLALGASAYGIVTSGKHADKGHTGGLRNVVPTPWFSANGGGAAIKGSF